MKHGKWMGFFIGVTVWLMTISLARAVVTVGNVTVKPRWPWTGKVDITYHVSCNDLDEKGQPCDIHIDFTGYDAVLKKDIIMTSLTGDGVFPSTVKSGGPYKVTWDASKDYNALNTASFQVKVHASLGTYMVVDLSGGPNAARYPVRYTDTAPNLDDDTCRTTELWLRRIPSGSFVMGSPSSESGRKEDEIRHEVIITRPYYIGVFECTGRQFELITFDADYDSRWDCYAKVLSYNKVRGTEDGAGWPANGHKVDKSSLMGNLQAKTGLVFDLPTEAQWEYAARGANLSHGYTYSGSNQTSDVCTFINMEGAGMPVGNRKANELGIYDMSGNAMEWCLDWYGDYKLDAESKNDPKGSDIGTVRVLRGGASSKSQPLNEIRDIRVASRRWAFAPSIQYIFIGCRIACHWSDAE